MAISNVNGTGIYQPFIEPSTVSSPEAVRVNPASITVADGGYEIRRRQAQQQIINLIDRALVNYGPLYDQLFTAYNATNVSPINTMANVRDAVTLRDNLLVGINRIKGFEYNLNNARNLLAQDKFKDLTDARQVEILNQTAQALGGYTGSFKNMNTAVLIYTGNERINDSNRWLMGAGVLGSISAMSLMAGYGLAEKLLPGSGKIVQWAAGSSGAVLQQVVMESAGSGSALLNGNLQDRRDFVGNPATSVIIQSASGGAASFLGVLSAPGKIGSAFLTGRITGSVTGTAVDVVVENSVDFAMTGQTPTLAGLAGDFAGEFIFDKSVGKWMQKLPAGSFPNGANTRWVTNTAVAYALDQQIRSANLSKDNMSGVNVTFNISASANVRTETQTPSTVQDVSWDITKRQLAVYDAEIADLDALRTKLQAETRALEQQNRDADRFLGNWEVKQRDLNARIEETNQRIEQLLNKPLYSKAEMERFGLEQRGTKLLDKVIAGALTGGESDAKKVSYIVRSGGIPGLWQVYGTGADGQRFNILLTDQMSVNDIRSGLGLPRLSAPVTQRTQPLASDVAFQKSMIGQLNRAGIVGIESTIVRGESNGKRTVEVKLKSGAMITAEISQDGSIKAISQDPNRRDASNNSGTPGDTVEGGGGDDGKPPVKKPTGNMDEPDPYDDFLDDVFDGMGIDKNGSFQLPPSGSDGTKVEVVPEGEKLPTDDKQEGDNKGNLSFGIDAGASASLTPVLIDNLPIPNVAKEWIRTKIFGNTPNLTSIDLVSTKISVKIPIAGANVPVKSISYTGDDGVRVILSNGSEIVRTKDGSVMLITPAAKDSPIQVPTVTYLEPGEGIALKEALNKLIGDVGKAIEIKGNFTGPKLRTDPLSLASGAGVGDNFEIKWDDLVSSGTLRKEPGVNGKFRLNKVRQADGLYKIEPVILPNTLPSVGGIVEFKIPIEIKMATEFGSSGKFNPMKGPKVSGKAEKAFGGVIDQNTLLTEENIEYIERFINSPTNGSLQIKAGVTDKMIVIRDSSVGGTAENDRLYASILSQKQLLSPKSIELSLTVGIAEAPLIISQLKAFGIDVKAAANGTLSWKFDPKQGEPSPEAKYLLQLMGYNDLPAGWKNQTIAESIKEKIGNLFGVDPKPLDANGPLLELPLNQIQVRGPDGKIVTKVYELDATSINFEGKGGLFDYGFLQSYEKGDSSSIAIQFGTGSSIQTIFIPVTVGELLTKAPKGNSTGPLNSASATDLKRWMDSVISTTDDSSTKTYLRDLASLINGRLSSSVARGGDGLTLNERDLVSRFLLASRGFVDTRFNPRIGVNGIQSLDRTPWWQSRPGSGGPDFRSDINDGRRNDGSFLVASRDLSGLFSENGTINPGVSGVDPALPSTLRYEIRNGKGVRVVGGRIGIVVPEPSSALDGTPAGVFRDIYQAALIAGATDDEASKSAYDAYKLSLQPELTTAYLNGYINSLEVGRDVPFTQEEKTRFLTLFLNQRVQGKSDSEAALAASNAINDEAPKANLDDALKAIGIKIDTVPKLNPIENKIGNLKTLKSDATEALRIARESGNQLGALLATLINGVLDTLLAKVDDSTKELAFSGGVNAIAAAAQAAGLTFSEFVQLIGRGDLAAFGAVIGDIGEVYKQANLGNTASTMGAGFELVGNALNAIGRQKGDKGLIIAGTAVNGIGGVLKATQGGPVGAATNAGFKMAGNLATVLGQLGDSNALQALGLTLNAVVDIPRLFTNYNPETGAGRTDGSAALASTASQIVGLLLGGEAGRIAAGIGGLVSTGFEIAGNVKPGGAGSLYVTAARQLLNLFGVKLDPAVNFALGTLSTALAGGPVGWAVWAVGVLFNLFSMGSFSKTNLLADNIDADGDGFADDSASLRQDFRRGFFGGVRQTGHQILYDVNGVDVRLLQNSQLSLTPEFRKIAAVLAPNLTRVYTTIDGQGVLGKMVDAQGRDYFHRPFSVPAAGEVFLEIVDYSKSTNPAVRDNPFFKAISGKRFAATLDPSSNNANNQGTRWTFDLPTGNSLLKIDAIYGAINPSTSAVSTTKTWVLNPTDAAAWRSFMGGDAATIGPNDPRAAAGGALAIALNDMTAQYRGTQNDPNLYMYMDMNGDNTPDLVRVGLQIDGLKTKGDGKVQVWLLDASRKQIGATFVANSFAEAEEIGLMSGQILNWGAGRPDLWSQGKDLGSLYIQAKTSGALALMKEANALTASAVTNLLNGTGNLEAAFARLDQINVALASPFNGADYMEANPDVAAAVGGNPEKAAIHYIVAGNSEGRAINKAGLVLPKAGTVVSGPAAIWSDAKALAYIASHQDLINAFGSDTNKARNHYNIAGISEGRQITFDPAAYMAANPDVATAVAGDFAKATKHYVETGVWEGRALGPNQAARSVPLEQRMEKLPWMALAYIASHPDLINAFGANAAAGIQHYKQAGATEGRQISFNPYSYMAANPDIAAWAGGDPVKAASHFIVTGRYENRVLTPGGPLRPADATLAAQPTPVAQALQGPLNGYTNVGGTLAA